MAMISLETILLLLLAFQLKHFLADYVFQTKYMLGKFKGGLSWVLPLSAHAGVHALFTTLIVMYFTLMPVFALLAALFDFLVHFAVDRIKASPGLLGRFNPQQKAYWVVLGLDQTLHHLTHYIIIICVVAVLVV